MEALYFGFFIIVLLVIIGWFFAWVFSVYKEDREIIEVKEQPIPCETCKCLLNKEDAYKVKAVVKDCNSWEQYFCKKCQPKYEKVVYAPFGDDAPNRYYKMLEVDENGIALQRKK